MLSPVVMKQETKHVEETQQVFWAPDGVERTIRFRRLCKNPTIGIDFLLDGEVIPVPLGIKIEIYDPLTLKRVILAPVNQSTFWYMFDYGLKITYHNKVMVTNRMHPDNIYSPEATLIKLF